MAKSFFAIENHPEVPNVRELTDITVVNGSIIGALVHDTPTAVFEKDEEGMEKQIGWEAERGELSCAYPANRTMATRSLKYAAKRLAKTITDLGITDGIIAEICENKGIV